MSQVTTKPRICECGCGNEYTPDGNRQRFIKGHKPAANKAAIPSGPAGAPPSELVLLKTTKIHPLASVLDEILKVKGVTVSITVQAQGK